MIRWALITAAISGVLAVVLGALGAHGLHNVLDDDARAVYATASLYHLIHTLALAIAALAPAAGLHRRSCAIGCALWAAGIVVFSGSLYLLSVTGLTWLGALTPIGGLALIAGWILLAVAGIRSDG